jgi:hypothetical protein
VVGGAEDKVTRVYMLKNSDVSNIERAINIAVRDPSHIRVVGGQGKRMVVTDTADQQDNIAQLLPVLDQPISETDPDKIQMRMLMNAAQYLRHQKIAMKAAGQSSGKAVPTASAPNSSEGAQSYDKFKSAKPYISVYASDDAKMLQGPHVILEEAYLPALSSLELKGIYADTRGGRLALLTCANLNYTARDGGLYQNNRARLQNVTSQIFKDYVLLTGPDHIPRTIKFKSTL